MPPENKSPEDEEAPLEVSGDVNLIIPANAAGKIEIHQHDLFELDETTTLILLQKTRYRA